MSRPILPAETIFGHVEEGGEPVVLSLAEFTRLWGTLFDACKDDEAAEMALTGVKDGRLICIAVAKNFETDMRHRVADEALSVHRDYDSLIGISHTLPYNKSLDIFVVSPDHLVLTVDNHMTCRNNRNKRVKMCSVPNMAIAKLENRGVIRIFFPNLEIDGVILDDDTKATVYERGILPARLQVWGGMRGGRIPQNVTHHFPPNYTLLRAMNTTRNQFSTRSIGREDVPLFGTILLELLAEENKCFEGAFFLHEMQGTKLAYLHESTNAADRTNKLQELLAIFVDDQGPRSEVYEEANDFEKWYIDVALQFSSPGAVVHWSRGGNEHALTLAFPHLSLNDASNATHSNKFRRDLAASLYDVSGWLCARPDGTLSNEDSHAITAIAYSTEKNLWHKHGNTHHGVFAPIQPKEMLSSESFARLDKRLHEAITILAIGAGQDDANVTQTGSARLEVRVPVQQADSVLASVPEGFGQDCFYAWDPSIWYAFKMARFIAILHVFRQWFYGHRRDGEMTSARLTVIPALVCISSGILSRERNGQWEKEAFAIIPRHQDELDSDGNPQDPRQIRGALFWKGWRRGTDLVAALPHPLNHHILLKAFGIGGSHGDRLDLWRDLLQQLGSHLGVSDPGNWDRNMWGSGKTGREGTKSKSTSRVYFWEYPEYDHSPLPEELGFYRVQQMLQGLNYYAAPQYSPNNPDVRQEDYVDPSSWEREESDTVAKRLEDVLRQFFHDIFYFGSKALKFNVAAEGTPAVFTSLNASHHIAAGAWVKFVSDQAYGENALNHFPTEAKLGKIQGVTRSAYIRLWSHLLTQVGVKNHQTLTRALLELLRGTVWLPHSEVDRMWRTGVKQKNTNFTLVIGDRLIERPTERQLTVTRGYFVVREAFRHGLIVGDPASPTRGGDNPSNGGSGGNLLGNDNDDNDDDNDHGEGGNFGRTDLQSGLREDGPIDPPLFTNEHGHFDDCTSKAITRLLGQQATPRVVFYPLQGPSLPVVTPRPARRVSTPQQTSLAAFFPSQTPTVRSGRHKLGKRAQVISEHRDFEAPPIQQTWTQGSAAASGSQPRRPILSPQLGEMEEILLDYLTRLVYDESYDLAEAIRDLEGLLGDGWQSEKPAWNRAFAVAQCAGEPGADQQECLEDIRTILLTASSSAAESNRPKPPSSAIATAAPLVVPPKITANQPKPKPRPNLRQIQQRKQTPVNSVSSPVTNLPWPELDVDELVTQGSTNFSPAAMPSSARPSTREIRSNSKSRRFEDFDFDREERKRQRLSPLDLGFSGLKNAASSASPSSPFLIHPHAKSLRKSHSGTDLQLRTPRRGVPFKSDHRRPLTPSPDALGSPAVRPSSSSPQGHLVPGDTPPLQRVQSGTYMTAHLHQLEMPTPSQHSLEASSLYSYRPPVSSPLGIAQKGAKSVPHLDLRTMISKSQSRYRIIASPIISRASSAGSPLSTSSSTFTYLPPSSPSSPTTGLDIDRRPPSVGLAQRNDWLGSSSRALSRAPPSSSGYTSEEEVDMSLSFDPDEDTRVTATSDDNDSVIDGDDDKDTEEGESEQEESG